MSKVVNVALLGIGVVGKGVYDILSKKDIISDNIRRNIGDDIELRVKKILVRDINKNDFLPKEIMTESFDEILNEDIDIVVEVMGGDSFAKDCIIKSLENKKNVVSANKLAIAKAKGNFEKLARENNVFFEYEASVGGTIPVIRVIKESLEANKISEISGIVNGTTNYILSSMTQDKKTYEECLAVAQKLGFAEADPTSDVDGLDPAYKMSILANLAFGEYPKDEDISIKGIRDISLSEIESAEKEGKVIKLLGKTFIESGKIKVEVSPIRVSKDNPLSIVNGAQNAISINCNNAGTIVLQGQGAGSLPTASAVVSDIINIARKISK